MKKLVLLLILAFAFNQSEVKSQSIVIPTEDIINLIDLNATDIVLENRTTGETYYFLTVAEMYASWSTLNCGKYRAEFRLNDERQRARFNIENCGELMRANTTGTASSTSSSSGKCKR